MYCRSSHPLDVLTYSLYRVNCGGPVARLAEPRERSFIVVERPPVEPGGRGRFCAYLLVKRGLPSLDAAAALARSLGAPWARVAGLKDTEATTAQLACLPCPPEPPVLVEPVPGRAWARLLGRLPRCPRRGETRGNCFTVVLEPLPGHAPREALERLAEAAAKPLPAYYGYQRFGTRRPNSHTAAAALLQGRLDEAVWEVMHSHYPDERLPLETRLDPRRLAATSGYEARMAREMLSGRAPAPPRWLAEILAAALQASVFNAYLSLRIENGYGPGDRLPGERPGPAALVPGIGYRPGVTGEARRLLDEALSLHGLAWEELAQPPPYVPRLRPYWRSLFTRAERLRIEQVGGRLVARFCLPRGMYATVLLREAVDPLEDQQG